MGMARFRMKTPRAAKKLSKKMRGEAARRIARPTGAVDSTIEMCTINTINTCCSLPGLTASLPSLPALDRTPN